MTLSCISLCSSILQLLNLVKSFGGHPVSFQGWVAKLALPGHFTSVSSSRIAQKNCQNKNTRNRVYATRKLSIPNDCILSISVFHVAVVLIQWRRETRQWTCIRHFGKCHNTLCLSPQILHKHSFCFLLGPLRPRETVNNAYAKFWGKNKEYYGIFRSGLLSFCPPCFWRDLWNVSRKLSLQSLINNEQ